MPTRRAPSRLLLITGAPASGKTRLAGDLGARYGGGRCSKDQIKEILFEALGTGDAAWSRRLSDASFALLFSWAPQLLAVHPLVLLEGNFRSGEHEPPLRALLEGSGARAAQVLCVAKPATRAARLAARAADPARHRGHRDGQIDPGAAGGARFLDLPGPRWQFNSDADREGELAVLCAELDRWYPRSEV
ncbi:MAG: AAA family ATPase [Steroidobacterales bacterium]